MVFQLSKHVIAINDTEDQGFNSMLKLNFTEFLEYFARLAFIRFTGSEMEGLKLCKKIKI